MIDVRKAGMLTTVQDLGRKGYQKYGVSPGGAADPLSHRLANIAIGNGENAATLEMTLQGDVLVFREATLISITGADMKPVIDGIPVPMWRPVYVEKGAELRFHNAEKGARTYVAVAGGFEGDVFLGSSSTYLSMEAGGFDGRVLKEGDLLRTGPPFSLNEEVSDQLKRRAEAVGFAYPAWRVPGSSFFHDWSTDELRVFPGAHFHLFEEESKKTFRTTPYQVGSKSDRMGVRFEGEKLNLRSREEIVSQPVTSGTIQVPASGQPILLLADRQTTGGYPKLAQLASADISKAAQRKPGESVRFQIISHRDAEQLFLSSEDQVRQCRTFVKRKVKEGEV